MTQGMVFLLLLGAFMAAVFLILLWHMLTEQRERKIARIRWGATSTAADRRRFTALEYRNRSLESTVQALRRENLVSRRRLDEVCQQLQAARDLGRWQEQQRLALTTLQIEHDTTKLPVVPTNVVPLRGHEPTMQLPAVRRKVLA